MSLTAERQLLIRFEATQDQYRSQVQGVVLSYLQRIQTLRDKWAKSLRDVPMDEVVQDERLLLRFLAVFAIDEAASLYVRRFMDDEETLTNEERKSNARADETNRPSD